MILFFYMKECPMSHECNKENFKKWEPWGWTEEECRHQVKEHLMHSGKHTENCPPGDTREELYESLLDGSIIESANYVPDQPKRKKQRSERCPQTPTDGAASAAAADGDAELGGLPACTPKHGNTVPPAALQQRTLTQDGVIGLMRMMSDSRGSASSSAPVDRQDLRTVSDSLARCVTAARHAQKLSAMAATAFSDEAQIFEDVKAFIDAKMSLA